MPLMFSRPPDVHCLLFFVSQLEAFYSIFTTEQQDHVKSVEYLRNNFRPLQSLDSREVYKSAIKDAWLPDLTGDYGSPDGTDSSNGKSSHQVHKVIHIWFPALSRVYVCACMGDE